MKQALPFEGSSFPSLLQCFPMPQLRELHAIIHSSSLWTGKRSGGRTDSNFCQRSGGHRICVAWACRSPRETGPKELLSKLCPWWSPSTQMWPRGTLTYRFLWPMVFTISPSRAITLLMIFCSGFLGDTNDTMSPRCTSKFLTFQWFKSTTSDDWLPPGFKEGLYFTDVQFFKHSLLKIRVNIFFFLLIFLYEISFT